MSNITEKFNIIDGTHSDPLLIKDRDYARVVIRLDETWDSAAASISVSDGEMTETIASVTPFGERTYEVVINGFNTANPLTHYLVLSSMTQCIISAEVTWGVPDDSEWHIITPQEITSLARPCYVDDAKAVQFIAEAERNDIIRKTGAGLWAWMRDNRMMRDCAILMRGGEWTDSRGNVHIIAGLKTACAYFAYSRIVTQGNIELTRTGSVNRTASYSERSDWQERLQASREAAAIGQSCLDEAMMYASTLSALDGIMKPARNDAGRTRIDIIGQ